MKKAAFGHITNPDPFAEAADSLQAARPAPRLAGEEVATVTPLAPFAPRHAGGDFSLSCISFVFCGSLFTKSFQLSKRRPTEKRKGDRL
jgi:hypothetical protein